jgi:Flp pilus assembly protein TadD
VARAVAKTLLAAGDAGEALAAVNRIPEQSRDHWLLYQQAKAELALNHPEEALMAAERALQLALNDARAEPRLAIYHDQVSQCLEALGRVQDAIRSATIAHGLVEDDKYSEHLRVRLEKLKQRGG